MSASTRPAMRPAAGLAAAALAALTITALVPTPSHADPYKWCAQYGGRDGGGRNCGFVSFNQCMATVRGMGGFCERNQFYTGSSRRRR